MIRCGVGLTLIKECKQIVILLGIVSCHVGRQCAVAVLGCALRLCLMAVTGRAATMAV